MAKSEVINIVGAGLSGLSAAMTLAEAGQRCRLISVQPSERAQSVLAEGGINAALNLMGEDDDPAQHMADTMKGGVYLADPNAVKGLTDRAPETVRRMMALGVPFQMEGGRMIQRNFGGQKKKRTAYARSSTGKALMTALIDAARRYEAEGLIQRLASHAFVRLILSGGRCAGVRVRDEFTGEGFDLPGRVILCSGGFNGMFPGMTTGTTANTGDVTATVFEQGAALSNLEFIQYHPTTIGIAGKRCLISEAARGEGGRLCVRRGGELWYFMEELYPELGNLMPRDVVSREMYRVVRRDDCEGQVYLDMTGLSAQVWQSRLSDLREELIHYLALDPAATPIPVEPGIHFFMGGIDVDIAHRTSIPGLYAAGECACQYHGANRLGGNSTLAALYGGGVAARTCLSEAEGPGGDAVSLGRLEPVEQPGDDGAALRLRDALLSGLGILRDEAGMRAALERVDAIGAEAANARQARRCELGRAMLLAALARRESRGAHTRTDFPERDEAFRRTTVITRGADGICVSFRDIPEIGGDSGAV